MNTVKEGLGFYALIKTYGIIFLGILFLLSALAFLFKVVNGNYKKSPNSKISYYTIVNSTECTNYEIQNNLCKLQLVYSDGTTIYKNDTPPESKIGDTTVFYEDKNPKSYMVTPSPYMAPGMFSCIASIILIAGVVRLLIIRSSKDGAALMGGLDMVSSISSRMPRMNYPNNQIGIRLF
jgi:hypothetical protein